MILETGKTYLITHSRKGTFMAKIEGQDSTWTDAIITGGQITTCLYSNVCKVGKHVGFRTEWVTNAVEQP